MSKKIIKIKIKSLQLSMNNPRFTFLNDVDDDLIEFISKKNYDYFVEKAILKLIKEEGNLSDFLQLVCSIKKYGWMDLGEEILIVHNKNNNYIVAEGNRRIMALKLILKLNSLPSLNSLTQSENFVENESHDEEIFKNEKDEKIEINYQKLEKILNDEEVEINNIEEGKINCRIINDSDELWRLIYTKHIVGERPGMRKWSRGKYFVDILKFFPEGIDKDNYEINKKITMTIQREINTVFDDYIQSQFVRDIFLSENDLLNLAYERMRLSQVSALQTTFSLKNIREVAKKEFFISKKEFDNFFKINIEQKKGKISYKSKKGLDTNKFLNFIYKEYINGALTTRPIKSTKYNDFTKSLKFLLFNKEIDFNKDNSEELINSIEGFDLKTSEIQRILDSSKSLSKETKKRLSLQKSIMENDEKLIEKIKNSSLIIQFKEDDPGNVFNVLKNQLIHNSVTKKFTAAQGFTLRAIYEQLIIWGCYFVDDLLKSIHSVSDLSTARKKHIDALSYSNITKLKNNILTSNRNIRNSTDIKDFLTKMLKNIPAQCDIDFLKDFRTKNINDFVHSSHRIVVSKSYNEKISLIEKLQNSILSLIDKIDNIKIKKLSDDIKYKLKN